VPQDLHCRACALAALLCALLPWTASDLRAAEPPGVVFEPPVALDTGEAGPRDLERADFNGDGFLDVAVLTTTGGGKVHFLLGGPAGGLHKDNTLLAAFASGIGSGDFNGDGVRDLAVTQGAKTSVDGLCDTPTSILPSTVIFLGTGGATPGFALAGCLRGTASLTDVAAGDFSGDGILDLAVADSNFYGVRLYRGVGDGTFLAPVPALGSRGVPTFGPLTTADMNGDGRLDLIARTGGVGSFFGNGSGGLTFSSTAVGSSGLYQHLGVQAFAVGDVNSDGRLDIVGVESGTLPATPTTPQNFLFVSLNSGDGIGYSSTDTEPFSPGTAGSVALADFNRDGSLDVVALHYDGNAARMHLGHGDGTLGPATAVPVGVQPYLATVGDWNADGWLDLAVVDRNQDNQSRTWVLSQVPGTLDGSSPTVALTSPSAGATLLGSVTLAATASDDVGVTLVEFYAGPTLIGTDATAPYTALWNTAAAPNGPYTLTAKAHDARGNVGTSPAVSVTVANPDTTAPTVSLTGPIVGSLLTGQVPLTASAADANGVTLVEFLYGGTLIGADTTPPSPFSVTWNTDSVAAGHYTLTARARDAAGNVGTSVGVPVTVDRPPTASAGPPQAVEATSPAGAAVTLAGTGTDPDPGDTLSYLWTEGNTVLGTTPSLTLGVPLGMHVFTLRVTDSYGLTATATVAVTVEDTKGPVLTLPADMTLVAPDVAGVTATFTASAVDAVDGPVGVLCTPDSGSIFPIGITAVTCAASDASGNAAFGGFTVAVSVAEQSTPILWRNRVRVQAEGSALRREATTGWDGGASSIQELASGDGHAEYQVSDTTSYVMFGLSHGDTDQGYADVDYAIYTYPSTRQVMVFEAGAYRASLGSYAANDILRVGVEGGVVTYSVNGKRLYTSSTPPNYPLVVDTSLYSANATLSGAKMGGELKEIVNWTHLNGAEVAGDTLKKTVAAGWAGAISSRRIPMGNGAAEYTVADTSSDVMFGLSHGDTDGSYADIDYAISTDPLTGQVMVCEGGLRIGPFAAYTPGDRLRVSVEDGVVSYWKNGDLLYTSLAAATYPLILDVSLYSGRIEGARLTGNVSSVPLREESVSWTNLTNVTDSGGTLQRASGVGWNAGAASIQALIGDGYAEYSVSSTSDYVMFGLSQGDTDAGYADLDYAIYTYPPTGRVMVFEGGAYRTTLGSYVAGDRLRVSVEDGLVTYRMNGALLDVSPTPPRYPLNVDTSLYSTGATVAGANFGQEE
jgi:hypothetical protein